MTASLIALFDTKKGRSYQCDSSNSIVIDFAGHRSSYKLKDFLVFQRMVNRVDILDLIYDLSDRADSVLIETAKKNFSISLNICEIVMLRDLLNGTKFVLNMNSMLCEVLNYDSLQTI